METHIVWFLKSLSHLFKHLSLFVAFSKKLPQGMSHKSGNPHVVSFEQSFLTHRFLYICFWVFKIASLRRLISKISHFSSKISSFKFLPKDNKFENNIVITLEVRFHFFNWIGWSILELYLTYIWRIFEQCFKYIYRMLQVDMKYTSSILQSCFQYT